MELTFDSKMTFEKHLRSISRSASQRLCILRKSWRVLHDRSLLGRCFQGFVFPVLEYCSAVWCSAADTHLKLLDRAVSGARFLTGIMFECDIAHRRSVEVLCICCIRSGVTPCTLLMVFYLDRMCQCGLHAVLWSHISTLMHHSLQNLAVPHDFCFPLSVHLERSSLPAFDGVGLAGFKSWANAFLLAQAALSLL